MSYAPIRLFVAGQEVTEYRNLHLERQKENLTGVLSFSLFYSGAPTTVLVQHIARGAEITVYVGGHLVFWGTVDKRQGKQDSRINRTGEGRARGIGRGDQTKGSAMTGRADANSYTITVRARGQTKRLIDSSHDHRAGTILGPSTRQVVDELVKSWRTRVEWLAPDYKLDKVRFRDGATVRTELHRVANENGLYAYETRDGKLRFCEGPVGMGEPIIVGISEDLSFLCEQNAEGENSSVTVKGHRTKKGSFGRDAVNRKRTVKNTDVEDYSPLVIQHDGDGDDDALERRAKGELDRQQADGKKVKVEMFHVQPKSGLPWDLGLAHYIQIPSEGVYDVMECTGVEYKVEHDKVLSTVLHFSAIPAGSLGGVGGAGLFGLGAGLLGGAASQLATGLGAIGQIATSIPGGLVAKGGFAGLLAQAAQARALAGIVTGRGLYPAPWSGASLGDLGASGEASPTDQTEVAGLPPEEPPLELEVDF